MDDYQKEISDLERQIAALEAEDEPDKAVISDLQVQLDILQALYRQATHLLAAGLEDEDMRHALLTRGYGDWNLDNVYAFVYDQAVELPEEPHRSFAGEIKATDFRHLLNA